jgi:hypothetical protein
MEVILFVVEKRIIAEMLDTTRVACLRIVESE